MRPLRLTMQAFGPFAGREVVDFREATSARLFGVYGPTGAGKSTIFSAMTFALFGEAAKAEQEAVSLRSDYAADDLVTEVELVFDIADRRYVIRRRPEQNRPKRRVSGFTKMPHEAWLFDATGLALDAISPDHAGKVIAEKKATVVRDAVEEMLGYPQSTKGKQPADQRSAPRIRNSRTDKNTIISFAGLSIAVDNIFGAASRV